MKEKLSFIIPVYNGKNIIERCLQSIFNQTAKGIQVIIVDDGSCDGSFEFIESWLEQNDTRDYEVILKKKPNGGIADARNFGIEHVTGEYLMFADHDDYFDEDYCERYLKAISSEMSDIVVGGYERVKTDKTVVTRVELEDRKWSKFVVLAPWAHIYRTSFIIENNIRFLESPIGEDIYFNLVAYSKTNKIKIINDKGYKWFFNTDSVSNSRQNIIDTKATPMFLLDSIVKALENSEFKNDILTEYFFARYVCWYMLFSSRGSKKEDIIDTYNKLHDWLKSYYPDYMKNPYINGKIPRGEIMATSRYVRIYYTLVRLGLMKRVLKLFGVK